MKTRTISMLLSVLMLSLFTGCGDTEAPAESAAAVSGAALTDEAPAEEAGAEVVAGEPADIPDLTEADRNLDFTGRKELIRSLTTELPITDEPVEFDYWLAFETATLSYIEGRDLNNHPIWANMEELTGVKINVTQVDSATSQEKFNLMIASGNYADLFKSNSFTSGVEYGCEEEIIIDLTELIPEYAPNYWTLINSDRDVYQSVQSTTGKLLNFWRMKDEVATPDDIGAFIRMDWLEDLDMEVPETYDELFEVLTAFKTEKGAAEPMLMYSTITPGGGCLIGGFGATAVFNDSMTNEISGFFHEDGKVVYGATADGAREFLSWLNKLNEHDLIDFDAMLTRDRNPFKDITAGYAQNGVTGYFHSNQPFGGVYTDLSSDENCNWWPVRDVAKAADTVNSFASEMSLLKDEGFCISSQCDEPEIAVQWIDFWYKFETK